MNILYTKLSNNINIWKYIFPINDINNNQIDNSINNILTDAGYCIKCGEYNKCRNCKYCNTILYYNCSYCSYIYGDNLICCYKNYLNNFIF